MPKGHTLQFWQSTIHAPTDQLLGLAKHAEHLGFEGAMGPDHTVWWGSDIASKYPYNDSGSIWWPEDAHWPDPWVSTAAMAAVTTRLRFGHHVFILPLRDPVNVAKAIATTSAIAGGRVFLGFGVGWMKEEFVAPTMTARGPTAPKFPPTPARSAPYRRRKSLSS
jgi:alkanesulfonate monooxygenase SsuD/methylene tetrahydromethanopterin reductase-like flavin-dependent oxidoreductase (luciferase family)